MPRAWLALFVAFALPATAQDFSQPEDERAAQASLPKAKDALWTTLAAADVKIDNENGVFTIQTTPAIDALVGKAMTISGFVLPLDESDRVSHFLLTRNTPVCPFCPPGEPDEVIEVTSLDTIAASYDLITMTGTFALIDNGDQGVFFQLKDARVKAD